MDLACPYCSVQDVQQACKQRTNANSSTQCDLFSWNKIKNNSQGQETCNHIHIKHKYNQVSAQSVLADPPSSCPNGLFFFIFLHIVLIVAGLQLPILPLSSGPGPPLPPPSKPVPFFPGSRQLPFPPWGQLYYFAAKFDLTLYNTAQSHDLPLYNRTGSRNSPGSSKIANISGNSQLNLKIF